jgi:hypothetical protein
MDLCEVLGKRAVDWHRWLELGEEAPADSIYFITHILRGHMTHIVDTTTDTTSLTVGRH